MLADGLFGDVADEQRGGEQVPGLSDREAAIGWAQSLDMGDGLPTKTVGQILRESPYRPVKTVCSHPWLVINKGSDVRGVGSESSCHWTAYWRKDDERAARRALPLGGLLAYNLLSSPGTGLGSERGISLPLDEYGRNIKLSNRKEFWFRFEGSRY